MTLVHPQRLILEKIYTVLTGDATLAAIVGTKIYSSVPKGAGLASEFPRVDFGELNLSDWSSHTFNGFDGYVMVHAWSVKDSETETLEILKQCYALLHNLDLGLASQGFPTINFRCALNQVIRDQDGRTYHGIQRYSITLGGN